MARNAEEIYLGRDNVNTFVVTEDGSAVDDLSSVTRVVFSVGGVSIDSDVVGSSVIWWTDTATFKGATVDVVKLKLGGQSLTAGTYNNGCLVLFDATNTDGICYGNTIPVDIHADCTS